ncbi:Scarecrow-like protein 3 [Bienertia sinuspersici]
MIEEGSSSVPSSPLQYLSLVALSPGFGSSYPWLKELKPEERGLCLIHLLLACANHVVAGNMESANVTFEHISLLASPTGDTMQRIAAYFTEAFADRLVKGYAGVHKALNSTTMSCSLDNILVRRLFFDLLPFLKVSYLVTNQAILEATNGEMMVHIIDLHSSEPAQWISLLQALSSRPEGPPHLRITAEQKGVLDYMATQLNKEAEILDIPFQFNPVISKLEEVDVESLRVKTGEALVINSVLQLHTLLAKNNDFFLQKLVDFPEVSSSDLPKLDAFLKALCRLSPKLMVVTEQESNHNGASLMERVMESLNFYAALFDCLESTNSRASSERHKLEKMMFGAEIKNIIACEGIERKVRHEKLEKWVKRIKLAGFCSMPLSYNGLLLARRFLHSNSYQWYNIKEDNGCFVICWQDRPLYSISAWRFRMMYD